MPEATSSTGRCPNTACGELLFCDPLIDDFVCPYCGFSVSRQTLIPVLAAADERGPPNTPIASPKTEDTWADHYSLFSLAEVNTLLFSLLVFARVFLDPAAALPELGPVGNTVVFFVLCVPSALINGSQISRGKELLVDCCGPVCAKVP
jgi:hypothetical protein